MSGAWYGLTVVAMAAVIRWYLRQEKELKAKTTPPARFRAKHNI